MMPCKITLLKLWCLLKQPVVYLASLALCIADGLTDEFAVMQGQAETGSSRQEPGLQHEATTAAVHAHTAAAEMQARGTAGGLVGPLGGEGRQAPSDEDPVSPTGSSGSALDPHLYRWAFAGFTFCSLLGCLRLPSQTRMWT